MKSLISSVILLVLIGSFVLLFIATGIGSWGLIALFYLVPEILIVSLIGFFYGSYADKREPQMKLHHFLDRLCFWILIVMPIFVVAKLLSNQLGLH